MLDKDNHLYVLTIRRKDLVGCSFVRHVKNTDHDNHVIVGELFCAPLPSKAAAELKKKPSAQHAASTSATVSVPKIQPTTVPRCISHLGFRRNLHTFNGGGGTSLSLEGTTSKGQQHFASDSILVEISAEMAAGTKRKYYLLGGKGGVGKTSCAASLAVKFANSGHPTLVVSTDPAHSLSDSFAQDLMGGTLVPVEGPKSPLYALEINPVKAREEFRSANQKNEGGGVKDLMDSVGLGMLADQIGEPKLGELLDTPPPGLDEDSAIAKLREKIALAMKSVFGYRLRIFPFVFTARDAYVSYRLANWKSYGRE
ncbi:ATPase GET3B-like protein [Drosera capensis]